MEWTLEFGLGIVVGGLAMSACWGLFWTIMGTAGLYRRTCRWPVVRNSLTVAAVPAALLVTLLWLRDTPRNGQPFFTGGLAVIPTVILSLGFRKTPDGQRAAVHLMNGMRHLAEELLGQHRNCSGCSHGYPQHPGDGP